MLNLAYNTLTGGRCLDDMELRRTDEAYLEALQEAINSVRAKLWRKWLSRAAE